MLGSICRNRRFKKKIHWKRGRIYLTNPEPSNAAI
jgi:hypothetical protein